MTSAVIATTILSLSFTHTQPSRVTQPRASTPFPNLNSFITRSTTNNLHLSTTIPHDHSPHQPPVSLEPKGNLNQAKPNTVYSATTACLGFTQDGQDRVGLLTYCWSVPHNFNPKSPLDLVIVLPGHGMDATWAHRALPDLAPDAIVIGLDPSREEPAGTGRSPGLDVGDIILMRDAILELTRTFPTAKIILVGHSQGAFAQVMLANRFPRLINGVVSLSGGLPQLPSLNLRATPSVFVHSLSDPLVPPRAAFQARDVIADAGGRVAAVITTNTQSHAADPASAAAAVAWVRALSTDNPDHALSAARALLDPPQHHFGLAAQILRRFAADPSDPNASPAGFKAATDAHKAQARSLLLSIEALGLRHTAALRADIPTPQALLNATFDTDLPAPAWVGHLTAIREQFRTVETVEAYFTELDLDAALDSQEPHARALAQAFEPLDWSQTDLSPVETFDRVILNLPKAYLHPWLPATIEQDVRRWHAVADELRLTRQQRRATPMVAQYNAALRQGHQRAAAINNQWHPPR